MFGAASYTCERLLFGLKKEWVYVMSVGRVCIRVLGRGDFFFSQRWGGGCLVVGVQF
mgnify:CR=1 FL=1